MQDSMTPGRRLWGVLSAACEAHVPGWRAPQWGAHRGWAEAYEDAAAMLAKVPDGWPEGWAPDEDGLRRRKITHHRGAAVHYVVPKDEDGRRAAWVIAGHPVQRSAIDRETLAKALYDEIEDLERRNATLTAEANAAVERAEEAERDRRNVEYQLAATSKAGRAVIDERDRARDHARRVEVRAARAEEALKLAHDERAALRERADAAEGACFEGRRADLAEALGETGAATFGELLYKVRQGRASENRSPFVEPAEDLRAEVQRLRRALVAALRGAQEIATSAAILAGDDDA